MDAYKRDFIEFMVRANVLTFGDFVAKSGRKTPYFVNTGRYRSGSQLRHLSRAYADAIERHLGHDFDVLFAARPDSPGALAYFPTETRACISR